MKFVKIKRAQEIVKIFILIANVGQQKVDAFIASSAICAQYRAINVRLLLELLKISTIRRISLQILAENVMTTIPNAQNGPRKVIVSDFG